MEKLKKHLDFGQIAELTGMKRDWVRRAWHRGEFGQSYLDTSENCSGHVIRIPEEAVREYVRRRTFKLAVVGGESQVKVMEAASQ